MSGAGGIRTITVVPGGDKDPVHPLAHRGHTAQPEGSSMSSRAQEHPMHVLASSFRISEVPGAAR